MAKIIQQDLTRFMGVFSVVFVSFCGALFLSLRFSKARQQFRCVRRYFVLSCASSIQQLGDSDNNFMLLVVHVCHLQEF